ncbi:hypothetical protein [Flexivirga sp.]|uniref:hypothetical protein n=1 Tax=Flexivirga sp. TaxID=1962927 RepID=UPI003F7FF046
MARARVAYAAAAGMVAAGLLAGCGGGSTGTASAPPWTEGAGQEGLVRATVPGNGSDRKVVDGGDVWTFTLATPDDPNVPSAQWPSADTVLTSDQLKGAIPEASAVTLGSCVKGDSGLEKTAKNASCTWSVSLQDGGGYSNSVQVSIVSIGADQRVTESWTSERNKNFANHKAGERFFASGSFSAKGSYYLDNDQSSVLVSDGNMAAWINLTFRGFNSLHDSRNTLLTGIFPVLAKDLADRMPRKYA